VLAGVNFTGHTDYLMLKKTNFPTAQFFITDIAWPNNALFQKQQEYIRSVQNSRTNPNYCNHNAVFTVQYIDLTQVGTYSIYIR